MANRLIGVLHSALCLALVVLSGGALAQLADPTRPPAAMAAPEPEAGEASGPLLQSVKIPKKGPPVALISGQQVRLGGRYGDSRLIRLNEREAVLDGPAGTLHLVLTPGIEKTNITTKSTAAKGAQRGSML